MMRTRFAPSPTGLLHLGHAYSALIAHDLARAAGGTLLLRIEDIDASRSRPEWEAAIIEDLHWLGVTWSGPILRQSDHLPRYQDAIDKLAALGVTYPCSCSRGDIRAALSAPQEGAPFEAIYPGTCRGRPMSSRRPGDAVRLDISKSISCAQNLRPLIFEETGPIHKGTHRVAPADLLAKTGDLVLGRKDTGAASYAIAAVVDDAVQEITHIIRGVDLFEITGLQVVLQVLLRLPTPVYHHHALIRDEAGRRLAKRDDARAIRKYREDGFQPDDIRALVGLARPVRP